MSPLLGPFSVARRSAQKKTSSSLLLRHVSKKGSVSEQLYSRRGSITMNLYAPPFISPIARRSEEPVMCPCSEKRGMLAEAKIVDFVEENFDLCWIADVLIVILTWIMIHRGYENRLMMFGSQLVVLVDFFSRIWTFLILKNKSINQTETNYWASRKTRIVCAVQLDYCSSNICMTTWH